MVQRDSQAAQFGQGNTPAIQQSSVGFARPDSDAFRGNTVVQQVSTDTSSSDRILNTLLGVASKLGQQGFEQSQQEALLAGAAAANSGKAEEELQTNPLTRDWSLAGFRDTRGRLAAADQQAQIAVDLKRMREKSPEEYGTYLAEKRTEMEGLYSGMTLDGRKAMLVQQATNDRANIAKHQAAHAQFIVDTEGRSIATGAQVQFSALGSAKVDAKVYDTSTDAALSYAVGSIGMNPKLPPELKAKLMGEYAEQALNGDHQALFLRMQRDRVPLPDGSTGPLMSMVDIPTQTKLSGMYRESLNRTEAARNTGYMERMAVMRADWANPDAPLQSQQEVLGFLREGISTGVIKTDEQYEARYQEYLQAVVKKAGQTGKAAAWAAGDSGKLLQLGSTQEEGMNAYMSTIGKHMTVPQVADSLMNIGINTGQELAFKKVGELLAPAFVQLGLRDNVDPQQAAALSGVLQRLETAQSTGNTGAYSQFLSAFSPEAQAKVAYMRDNLKNRMDPVSAIAAAGAKVLEESTMTPAQRAELASSKAKDVTAVMADMTSRDVLGTVSLYAKSIIPGKVGERASNELRTRAFEGWWDSSDQVDRIMANTKLQLQTKMYEIQRNNPSLSAQSVKDKAMADISGRTVDTKWGPLTVPDGFTAQRYFGVDVQVPNDRIGAALQQYIKPRDGNRLSFSMGLQGQLIVEELNQKGDRMGSMTVDPKAVGSIVEQQQADFRKNADAVWGRGIVQNGLRFNGDNTGNADQQWMLDFRKSVLSVGNVQINVSKEHEAGASAAFNHLTNVAAGYGQRMSQALGKTGEPAFQFFSTVALVDDQFNKHKEYQTMLRAMKANDVDSALTALRTTPMAKDKDNMPYYESLLRAAMKGQ